MDSKIARALNIKPRPLAMMFADEKPAGALEYDNDRWVCIISLLDAAAAGRTLAIGAEAQTCMMTGRGRCHPRRPFVNLPAYDVNFNYVILKPLSMINPDEEKPEVISMFVNNEQLAALVQLANHARDTNDAVYIPRVTGCQACYLLPYHESQQENPRAVVGMTDPFSRRFIDADKLSFSLPFTMFTELEAHVAAGVLPKLTPHS